MSMFVFPYLIVLLYGSFVYPVWDRLGLHVQFLCVGLLSGIGVIISLRESLIRFTKWFLSSGCLWLFILINLWLFLMLFVHGVGRMARDGLLSGFLVALAAPFVVYSISNCSRPFWGRCVGISLFSVGLLECIYLGLYKFVGVPLNAKFLFSGLDLPRVFLNTRDGGFLALSVLICGVFLVDFYAGSEKQLKMSIGLFLEIFLLLFVGF